MNIFGGIKILWTFFFFFGGGGSSQNWTVLGVISMHFRVFLLVNVQNGGYFRGC